MPETVIVTGSSRGIGKHIALAFGEKGDDVIVNYEKNREMAEDVVGQIHKIGVKALAIQADVRNREQVETMIERTFDEFGKIDVLVNNAGNNIDILLSKMPNESWDKVIDVNLNGVFNCTRAVINGMRERGSGKIINIVSVHAQTGVRGASNYAAAKSGVIGFTKSVAREVARKGITVNAIALGFINAGMLLRLDRGLRGRILKQIPIGRFGEPEEVAKLVLFLSSNDADYITGQVINMNGGYYSGS